MPKAKTQIPEPFAFAPDVFDQETSPDQWLGFADALAKGDVATVRAFLASHELPAGLAKPLSLVRSEAKRLQVIVEADIPQSEIDAATIERNLLRTCSPQTAEDASKIGKNLAATTIEIAAMESRHREAENARCELAGLENVFAELFTGEPGKKACGGLFSAMIHNALVEGGFDQQLLFRQPWREAYRLQADTSTKPRRRLRAVGGNR